TTWPRPGRFAWCWARVACRASSTARSAPRAASAGPPPPRTTTRSPTQRPATRHFRRATDTSMKFEVEVSQDDAGQWLATAIEYQVSATGRTEKEALARVMEALAAHIKQAAK